MLTPFSIKILNLLLYKVNCAICPYKEKFQSAYTKPFLKKYNIYKESDLECYMSENSNNNQIKTKTFHELTNTELYEILKARADVFVVEQTCIYPDIDGKDYDSLHIFIEEDGKVIAYLRAFQKDENTIQMGRVLTTKRNIGLGSKILKEGIQQIKERFHPDQIYIEAQCYAIPFYEKEGFQVHSDEFLEDGIPHVEMLLILEDS